MILFTFSEKRFDDEPHLAVTAGRWALAANVDPPLLPFRLGFFEQRQSKGTGEWSDDGYYFGIFVNERWRSRGFGYRCVDYDGTHEVVSLGPFQIAWCNGFLKSESKPPARTLTARDLSALAGWSLDVLRAFA